MWRRNFKNRIALIIYFFFSRVAISSTYVEMVIGRLRSDDIYNQVTLDYVSSYFSTSIYIRYLPLLLNFHYFQFRSYVPPSLPHLPPPSLLDIVLPQPGASEHSSVNSGRDVVCHSLLCPPHSDESAGPDERNRGQTLP